MLRRRLPHGTQLLALFALLATLVVAGCGGDDAPTSGAGPDPATVAPADAFLYGEVVVRPTGDIEAGARAALRKVLRVEDPGAELVRLIDEGLSEGGEDMTYADNVEPWLGERAGGFLQLSPAGFDEEPEGAIAVAVADRDALDEEIDRQRDAGDIRAGGTYRGVSYDVDAESGDPNAVVSDFLVIASSVESFRAAVDASRGDSLADASRYETASGEIDDDALAFLFVDPEPLSRQLGALDEVEPQLRRALRSSRFAEADPVVASLTASADEIAFEAIADSQLVGDALDADDSAVTVGDLPGDAWLALATPPLGPAIRQALDSAGVLGEAAAQLRQGTGLELDRDLLGVIGGLGVFVRGSSPLAVGAGALLRTTSEAGARRLVNLIESIVGTSGVGSMRPLTVGGARGFQLAIPQAPQAIVVLARGAAIAAGYPASSAQDLLDPQQRFEDSPTGRAAIDSLGEGFTPSFVLLAPPLVDLLRSLDQLQVADLAPVLPYLRAYDSLAIGTQHDDDRTTVRGVVTLR
ncbi:MAG TPA: DUF3352 domain-containing protein [Conexibacter sp.]|nr:DUF3352 domain-containing protein [Conexibacter sp.]